MITAQNLYNTLLALIPGAKFSFRPIEAAMPGEVTRDNWSIDWSTVNTDECPSLQDIQDYLTPERQQQMYYDELMPTYGIAMQSHIDETAQSKKYSCAMGCATYASSTVEEWKSQADSFVAWRDSCWQYSINLESEVRSGIVEAPTVQEFIAQAPVIVWP